MGQKILELRSILSQAHSVLLDTSALIYQLEEVDPYYLLTEEVFDSIVDEEVKGCISVLSITEFVVKPLAEGKIAAVKRFEQFVFSLPIQVIEVTHGIASRAGMLRSQYPSVPTVDALIVSTALEGGCDTLITNDKDLKKLDAEGITVIVLSDFVELH